MNAVNFLSVLVAILVPTVFSVFIDFKENCGTEPGIVHQIDFSPCYGGDSSSGCALDHILFHAKDGSLETVHPNITIQFTPSVSARNLSVIVSAFANYSRPAASRRNKLPRNEAKPIIKKQTISVLTSLCQNSVCELTAGVDYAYAVFYQGNAITDIDILAALNTGSSSHVTDGLMWTLVDGDSQVLFCFTTPYVQPSKEYVCDGTNEQNQQVQMCKRKSSGSVVIDY